MKHLIPIAMLFIIGLLIGNEVTASVMEYQVTYVLDGGINNPNNPTTYNEYDTFYFGDAYKEGFIFDGWYLDLADANSKVTLRILPNDPAITLYAKFTENFEIIINPNNGEDPFTTVPIIRPSLSELSSNSVGINTINPLFVTHPLVSTDKIYHVFISGTKVFAKPSELTFLESNSIQIGTLPSAFNGASLYAIEEINGKLYGVAHSISSSTSGNTNVFVFEIDNTSVVESTDVYTNTYQASIQNKRFSFNDNRIVQSDIIVTDFDDNGYIDIFLRYLSKASGLFHIVSFTFDHDLGTLTKDMEYQFPTSNVSKYQLFDFDRDGIQELVLLDTGTKTINIYSYDEVNNEFRTILKSITIGNSYTFLNFYDFEVGYFLSGNTPVVVFEEVRYNQFSQPISHFRYVILDEDLNMVGEVSTLFFSRIENVNLDIKVGQLDSSGVYGFYIYGFDNNFGYRAFYATKKDGTGFEVITEMNANNSLSSVTIEFAFIDNIGYVSTHELRTRRTTVLTYSSEPRFPSISLSKDGYRFSNFNSESDFSGTVYSTNTKITSDLEVYANWTPNTYTVIFNSNGGTSTPQQSIVYDTILEAPTPPTKTHYEFVEWRINGISGDVYNFDEPFQVLPQFNYQTSVTFVAVWNNLTYTVIHETNSDLIIDNYSGDSLTYYDLPRSSDLVREGYTLDGWYLNSDFSGSRYTSDIYLNQPEITVYAKWIVGNYDIIFKGMNNVTIETVSFDFNETVTEVEYPTAPIVVGYTFKEWNATIPTIMPGFDVEIIAVYEINQYTITFDSAGGSEVQSITQEYNTAVVAPSDPTRTGYTFSGWDAAVPSTIPAENVTLTATWSINQYTLSFDSNAGSAVNAITQDYNSAVTAPNEPTRTGYTFNGWFSDEALETAYVFSNMPAENITLYAKWTINTYTLTFDSAGGSEVAAITQDYNTAVVAPSNPTRIGYTFSGWDVPVPATMPAENITLLATWTPITYTITFNTNNGMIAQNQVTTYTVESPNVNLLDASRIGFVFKGWFLEATFETEVTQINAATTLSNINVYALFFSDDFQAYLDAVENLPTPLSKEDKETILDLLEALESYSSFEQGYVDKDALEEALSEVKALEVTYVESLITSLPSPIGYEDLETIEAAKEALDALDNDQQSEVSNQELLDSLLEILVVVEQIEALVNSEEIDEASFEALVLEFDSLSEEQKATISESVLLDYEMIQDEMSGLGLFAWIGISFSLLLVLLVILWYMNKKRRELKDA